MTSSNELAAASQRQDPARGLVSSPVLEPVERMLATHPSKVIRDLAADQPPRLFRALHAAYYLHLPNTEDSETVFAEPYELLYKILAGGVGLDVEALLAVATSYRRDALGALPEQKEVARALEASRVKHVYTLEGFAASRAAFGRVVADLRDAGLLDGAPEHVQHMLRSVDLDVLHWTPVGRPQLIPAPPAAGVDKGLDDWQAGVEDRIDEYILSSSQDDRLVIGANSRLGILNWGRLREYLKCGTTVGRSPTFDGDVFNHGFSMVLGDLVTPTEKAMPEAGDCLILANEGMLLHDDRGMWLAFRPDFAASLGWTPDADRPGRWHTSRGGLAVETIYWVDGWWGRSGPAFDDTQADGHAVVLTASGFAEVAAAFGELTRHFELTRSGHDDGVEVDAVSAKRRIPVSAVEP